ncbi:uncharacterized protein N7482_003559 [Penicillium canariense]|uniref:Uncharacterized protein n=1 Tax=Penicillium canariense TaxID=189055 RepID=A0A9W9LPF5_9EURO|nr:uncharacterized protein N7482_003559 [Penicillium canariense]KAJ5167965.1 hypothetical protein N7482_003559 [Penicillium canariense]
MYMDVVTGILAPGALDTSISQEQNTSIDIGLEKLSKNLASLLVLPTEGKGSEPIYIGSMFQFVLHTNNTTVEDRQNEHLENEQD